MRKITIYVGRADRKLRINIHDIDRTASSVMLKFVN
jgi:hypothetical protein